VIAPHEARAREALAALRAAGLMAATAESCTGGLVAGALTDVPGSSAVVERGFVVYSNAAKTELLGVPEALIAEHGAVSEPVARAMAEGALAASRADVAVAITGVAGPGGSESKPEGLVHFACARRGGPTVSRRREYGPRGRGAVRFASVDEALDMLLAAARGEG
jgi:nicotinamide-nucleotide amidase